jgi:hypothetical protein
MSAGELFGRHLPQLVLWGLIATVAMTTILQASQGLGLSRLSLPFLVGTFFTRNRNRATVIGFIVYALGGWGFAMLYFLFFAGVGIATWWLGALLGFLHGLFLLAAALPLLPYAHPRMASDHDGPRTAGYILEPPGFFGLNYGRRTPLATLLGQVVYWATLGGLCQVAGVVSGGGG